MLIDLHCHTKARSACSALTPDALVRAARARGVDGVCITEHDALWPVDEARRLAEEMEFVVLRGVEVTTEVGHVLAFGLERVVPEMSSLAALHRIARAEGALMFLAHPSRRYGTLPPDDLNGYFESVEVQNASEGMLQNDNAAHLARGMRLPGIGGSDAHSAREAGVCATRFDVHVRDDASFIAALRSGVYRAVRT